jgi:hypothetical protein
VTWDSLGTLAADPSSLRHGVSAHRPATATGNAEDHQHVGIAAAMIRHVRKPRSSARAEHGPGPRPRKWLTAVHAGRDSLGLHPPCDQFSVAIGGERSPSALFRAGHVMIAARPSRGPRATDRAHESLRRPSASAGVPPGSGWPAVYAREGAITLTRAVDLPKAPGSASARRCRMTGCSGGGERGTCIAAGQCEECARRRSS